MRPFILVAVAALAACSEPGSDVSNSQDAAERAGPMAEENVVMSEPITPRPGADPANDQAQLPPNDDADQCGASEYQYLVGRNRSEIPEKSAGATWRITCTSCPITMDYSPARMNIFYDEETEVVEEVRCG